MKSKQKNHIPTEKDVQTKLNVLANFKRKGTSFAAYCEQNNINRRNAERALLRTWQGKKAKALRSLVIQASKAKPN